MSPQHFQTQINRLVETFGKNHYGHERTKLIWRDVESYSNEWFSKIVDTMIQSHRHPPLPADFAEFISIERERIWKIEKEQHSVSAQDFSGGGMGDDDKREICRLIVKRAMGGVSDDEWARVLQMMEGASRMTT